MPQDIKIELNNLIKEIYGVFDISSIYLVHMHMGLLMKTVI